MTGSDRDVVGVVTRGDMKRLGRVGGRSRSEAKRQAARANQVKAVLAKKAARLGRTTN